MKKKCLDCKQEKDNSLFVKDANHSNGTKNICKACAAKRKHIYYEKHADRVKAAAKKYREANPEKVAARKREWSQTEHAKQRMREYNQRPKVKERYQKLQWKRKYGVTEEESTAMLIRQHYKCAICGEYLEKPFLDHCHATNKARGFLCVRCNVGLGSFQDDPLIMLNAIKYLEKNGDFEVVNRRILPNGKVV